MNNKKHTSTTSSLPSTTSLVTESKTAFEGKPQSEFEQFVKKEPILETPRTITLMNQNRLINGIMIGEVINLKESGIEISFSDGTVVSNVQTMVAITDAEIGAQCAVMFQQGLIDQPMIMGLLIEPVVVVKPLCDDLNSSTIIEDDTIQTNEDNDEDTIPEAVCIQAKQQIILQCGDATLYMDADGHVETRGNRVITHSTGLNRIKGASVKIN